MNRLVEQSPAGAKGLVFLPYLVGERSPRWNPDASGSFLGIRMEHEKCDYIRAVLEGVAMNLGIILEKQRENGEIQDLVLTGGGAKGDTLSQILADVSVYACTGRIRWRLQLPWQQRLLQVSV